MDGLVEGEGSAAVCPECGWRAERASGWFGSRRRKGWALAAVMLALCAAAGGLTPKVRRDGVWSVVPTWVMWGVARTGRVPSDDYAVELARRISAGDRFDDAAQKIYRWTPRMRLTRERGVAGVPLRGRLWTTLGRNYLRSGFRFSIMGWLANDADVDAVQSHENWWTPGTHVLRPSPSVSGSEREFVTQVECQSTVRSPLDQVADFPLHIPLERSIDLVMEPVSMSGESLCRALKPSLFVLPTTRNLALSVADVDETVVGGVVALGVRVEIVRKGEVVARGRWFQSPAERTMTGRPVLVRFGAYDPLGNVNGPMTCTLEELLADGCVVRFGADEEMALGAIECDRYWRGSFEVPLKELVK